jgi:hypothetical protein
MDTERTQRYLESLLGRGDRNGVGELLPLVTRWGDILASIPGLQKRRPSTHCRVAGLTAGVLIVEADHPAWMQLLQWHEHELVARIGASFPVLKVQTLQFRLVRAGQSIERPVVVMPDPVKPPLDSQEQAKLDALLAEMEGLIQRNRGK